MLFQNARVARRGSVGRQEKSTGGNRFGSAGRFRKVNEPLRDTDREPEQLQSLATFKAEAWPLLPSLLRVALVLTGDHDHAEDLVQETMMRAYRHIASYRPGTNMKAWLMTILRRTHIDLHRREARRVSTVAFEPSDLESLVPASPETEPADQSAAWSNPDELLNRFDDELIEDALRQLPDAMRWVLLLVDVEQMSVADTAAALDVPEGTVKSRASRARTRLRELLHPLALDRGWLREPQEG